jgi:hypothetical protein
MSIGHAVTKMLVIVRAKAAVIGTNGREVRERLWDRELEGRR